MFVGGGNTHTNTRTHTHTHAHMQTHTHTHAETHALKHTCTHTHAHTHMHTRTCTYTHAHTCRHTSEPTERASTMCAKRALRRACSSVRTSATCATSARLSVCRSTLHFRSTAFSGSWYTLSESCLNSSRAEGGVVARFEQGRMT